MSYIMRVLLGLDQFGNTIIGGAPDETISARAGRLRDRFFWKQLAWVLDWIDRNHVEDAIQSERRGTQQDPAYQDVYDPEDTLGGGPLTWQSAALIIGENLGPVGPTGYYSMSPDEWLLWALGQLERLHNGSK